MIIRIPSIWPKPFGRISVEAMAAGKPVVAFNVGGILDTIEHGKTGILVEPKNPKKIADSMKYLLDNPDVARVMGKRGRKLVKEKYSADVIGRKYLEIYKAVLRQ